eukprot:gene5236-5471_t
MLCTPASLKRVPGNRTPREQLAATMLPEQPLQSSYSPKKQAVQPPTHPLQHDSHFSISAASRAQLLSWNHVNTVDGHMLPGIKLAQPAGAFYSPSRNSMPAVVDRAPIAHSAAAVMRRGSPTRQIAAASSLALMQQHNPGLLQFTAAKSSLQVATGGEGFVYAGAAAAAPSACSPHRSPASSRQPRGSQPLMNEPVEDQGFYTQEGKLAAAMECLAPCCSHGLVTADTLPPCLAALSGWWQQLSVLVRQGEAMQQAQNDAAQAGLYIAVQTPYCRVKSGRVQGVQRLVVLGERNGKPVTGNAEKAILAAVEQLQQHSSSSKSGLVALHDCSAAAYSLSMVVKLSRTAPLLQGEVTADALAAVSAALEQQTTLHCLAALHLLLEDTSATWGGCLAGLNAAVAAGPRVAGLDRPPSREQPDGFQRFSAACAAKYGGSMVEVEEHREHMMRLVAGVRQLEVQLGHEGFTPMVLELDELLAGKGHRVVLSGPTGQKCGATNLRPAVAEWAFLVPVSSGTTSLSLQEQLQSTQNQQEEEAVVAGVAEQASAHVHVLLRRTCKLSVHQAVSTAVTGGAQEAMCPALTLERQIHVLGVGMWLLEQLEVGQSVQWGPLLSRVTPTDASGSAPDRNMAGLVQVQPVHGQLQLRQTHGAL